MVAPGSGQVMVYQVSAMVNPEAGLALLQLARVAEDGMGRDKILYLAQPLQE